MALPPCSSSLNYDVFLSFRGSDTRHGFTGHLYKALVDKGIYTFIDDEELQRGEEITPALVKAIKESRIAIIVLSINYASSSFCLDELVTILDCAKTKAMLVLPVFYNIDPSHVRHQKGSFGEALAMHGRRFKHNEDKLHKWKMALHQVANLSGYHFEDGDGYAYQFLGRIVEHVSNKIVPTRLHIADYPVGLGSQVVLVRELVDVKSDDGVHMIGIHGMGGIGKTTLALAVYNLIADHFDGKCFLQNVREKANNYGLEHLQSIFLSEILGEKKIKLTSIQQGISMIQLKLQRKKVLLVLDDVDKSEQLLAIAGGLDWFGPGSRIVITTRDKHLLTSNEVRKTYQVGGLNKNDALQLLTWKAFKKENVDSSYKEVLNNVVNYASGLPLALEVIGSNLFGKSTEEWKSAINQYERIPNDQILRTLKVSFDALEEEEKSVFLDIACCFKSYTLTEVEDILRAHYGHCMKYHIGVLVEKSLIKLTWDTISMHDLIEDMGKEIVRQESPKDPGKRSRLWLQEDTIKVLEDCTGTSDIEIVCLNSHTFQKDMVEWNGMSFEKMQNLKTLIVKGCDFSQGAKYLPNSLRVLEWWHYPSCCLPSDFNPKKLTIFKLRYSWAQSFELDVLLKRFVNLRVLKFDLCQALEQIPDVSGLSNLEELSLINCWGLITVHDSIGFLDKLRILNATRCAHLRSFPPLKLTSLEELDLSYCFRLWSFPEILVKMENIRRLGLTGTNIIEFPSSVINLLGLKYFLMTNSGIGSVRCRNGSEPFLWEILATQCKLNDDFFSIGFMRFAHVKRLDLSDNNFTILPESMKEFQCLETLDVSFCKHLREIRGIPPNLQIFNAINCESLTSSSTSMLLNQELHEAGKTCFSFTGASIPEWLDQHSKGPSISFWFRNNFPRKVLLFLIAPGRDSFHELIPRLMMLINGELVMSCNFYSSPRMERTKMDHTYLIKLNVEEEFMMEELFYENKWNHVEFILGFITTSIKASGIHVIRQGSNMEDIQFNNPNC